eukprot:CAMPEP_0119112690 /NCGR_PEP_ID=MMETSP1180-20130426/41277_1 /TAXON_ID=3052 ORGANISM="Chlamydomonas cf sp, Strain CCMP681" /NCGR_SAMPLE_ID=MMETSP1180 /ASSEMBLY_ACC=CAM_ASM_000741 /LENGTH=103 /DNA_ID=CAMNT_0007100331 /DNA_START=104 /DNA_END=411 /DNA_ORIENTATION=-
MSHRETDRESGSMQPGHMDAHAAPEERVEITRDVLGSGCESNGDGQGFGLIDEVAAFVEAEVVESYHTIIVNVLCIVHSIAIHSYHTIIVRYFVCIQFIEPAT